MRYLVTGGAGFIGSNIVDELVRRDHSVAVLDDFSSGKEESLAGLRGADAARPQDVSEPRRHLLDLHSRRQPQQP